MTMAGISSLRWAGEARKPNKPRRKSQAVQKEEWFLDERVQTLIIISAVIGYF